MKFVFKEYFMQQRFCFGEFPPPFYSPSSGRDRFSARKRERGKKAERRKERRIRSTRWEKRKVGMSRRKKKKSQFAQTFFREKKRKKGCPKEVLCGDLLPPLSPIHPFLIVIDGRGGEPESSSKNVNTV